MQIITVPKELKMQPSMVGGILSQIEFLDEDDKEVLFDFTSTKWISAELSVFLGALQIFLFKNGYKVLYSPIRESVKTVLAKNGFLSLHGLGGRVPDINNTTISYKIFMSENYEEIDNYLTNDVFAKITQHVLEESLEIVRDSIFEIVHNIKEHSGSNELLMCGQWYPQKNQLSLAIADVGKSIPTNINDYFKIQGQPIQANWWTINWATLKGNSTKDIPDGGLGLYELKSSFMEHGELKILSKDALLSYNKDQGKYAELKGQFPGTLLQLEFEIK